MTPIRLSPIHDSLLTLNGTWETLHAMPTLQSIASPATPKTVGIADRSYLTRFGVKGSQAANWLHEQGISTPDRPNTWVPLPEGGLVARLGLNEFLIEDSLDSAIAPRLAAACQSPPPKVYPVLRQDLAIALHGQRVPDLMHQTCSVNLQVLDWGDRPVLLTSMIGISVTLLPGEQDGIPHYRIWCDGTYGTYFWTTLLEIATELGGGAIARIGERFQP
ncbi:MAG: methylglutamate dehydrogenase [Leptolyngbyaceae cyanobacterium SL_7_1]|nr:methylglutamate dehydrogenase [Leptolyngbyaceae cyanobacterium SL_7_1]